MTGVSTYSLNTSLRNAALTTQSKLAAKQVQEATGLTSDTYGGLGSNSTRVISLASELEQAQSVADNAAVTANRVEAMYSAVDGMTDILTNLRAEISSAMSSTDNVTLNAEGASAVEDLAALMNTQTEGRYLFSGSSTDTRPVDLDAYGNPTDPLTADGSYYAGNDDVLSVRVDGGQSISYGVTADTDAFELSLRVASVLSSIATDPIDTATLEEAYDLASEALEGLTSVQSQLSVTAERLERVQTTQEEYVSFAQTLIDDIKNVDVAQVAIEVSQYELLLEAAYSAIAKLDDMNLSKYI